MSEQVTDNLTLVNRGLEIRTEQNIDYVRCGTLPETFRNRIACSKDRLDRRFIKTLYTCCNTCDEYIEKGHFLSLTQDLI